MFQCSGSIAGRGEESSHMKIGVGVVSWEIGYSRGTE